MGKSKGNNTASKPKQAVRTDGLERVMLVVNNKARMVWRNKSTGEVVS